MASDPAPSLANLRVVVTRAANQSGDLAAAFAAAGARVELLPLLEVVPPADPRPLERAAAELPRYDWLVLTSANAVEALLPLIGGTLPPTLRVAVVGRATAEALLLRFGVNAELTGERDAEDLLQSLSPYLEKGRRILLPQAADARPTLAEGLAAAGAEVTAVIAYDKRLPEGTPRRAAELFSSTRIGWVTFTSGRIAEHFSTLFATDWAARRPELQAASIGRVTSAALRRLGVEPAAEAETPSDAALVAAVVRVTGT
jgi:uroporphyrinogen-III synthase